MNDRGFTLVEMVVALVISSFLAGVVFQLLNGQQRFVGMQSAREEVQQNGRATLELISAEIRSASPDGIISADSTSIEFRVPRTWGLVCAGGGGAWTVVFPGADLAAFKVNAEDQLAVQDSTTGASPRWRFTTVTDATPAAGGGAGLCGALTPDAGRVQVRTFTDDPATIPVQVGEPAYLFDVVRYDVGPSNVAGDWVRRTESGSTQPLAGPLGDDAGGNPVFRLRYFAANGAELASPVATPSGIAQIQVRVTTRSRSSNPLQQFSDSTRVHLRN